MSQPQPSDLRLYQLPQREHETYEGPSRILSELPIVGRMRILQAIPNALRADRHRGEYELHLILSGTLAFWVGDRNYELRPGMAFFTQPGELHGGVDAILQPGEWYWLRFVSPARSSWPELSPATLRQFSTTLRGMREHLFPASALLRNSFIRLIEEHRHARASTVQMARLAFHQLLIALFRDYSHRRAQPPGGASSLSPEITQAVHWLEAHLTHTLPLIDDIAAEVGLSESHFRRRFTEETGFSPLDYVTRRRVERAKELLAAGKSSLTDLAFDLGFQSSAYFAHVFRKLVGMTPSQFRAQSRRT